MSIIDWSKEDRISGFDMACDECGFFQFFNRTYFADFIIDAKAAGWKIIKEKGEWFHKCPKCVELDKTSNK